MLSDVAFQLGPVAIWAGSEKRKRHLFRFRLEWLDHKTVIVRLCIIMLNNNLDF